MIGFKDVMNRAARSRINCIDVGYRCCKRNVWVATCKNRKAVFKFSVKKVELSSIDI